MMKPTDPVEQRMREDRAMTLLGMTRRIQQYGFHPHCNGCKKLEICGIPADPPSNTVVECSDRPGPLFLDYLRRKGETS